MREGAALWRRRCAFLNDQKGTKESPGNGSDERLRGAGAHSHLFPGPLFTGAGPFEHFVRFGGLSFDRASLSSRALGPTNLKFSSGWL